MYRLRPYAIDFIPSWTPIYQCFTKCRQQFSFVLQNNKVTKKVSKAINSAYAIVNRIAYFWSKRLCGQRT